MNVLAKLREIDTFIFDIDGVLTNGSILVLESGEMARLMNVKDGYALQLAIKKNYRVFIISGSSPSAVERRLRNLGIEHIYFKVEDKQNFISALAAELKFDLNKVLYMGDDIPDLPVFQSVGMSACPADAVTEIRNKAQFISTRGGGSGCVREVIEKVMKAKGDWTTDASVPSA